MFGARRVYERRYYKRWHFSENRRHALVRARVFTLDDFKCRRCGAEGDPGMRPYDGRLTVPLKPEHLRAVKLLGADGWYFRPCGVLIVDHVVPMSRGGANHESNLQTLCDACNNWKRDKVLD